MDERSLEADSGPDHLVKIDDGQSTHVLTAKEWIDLARRNFEEQRSDRDLASLKEEIRSNITAASAMLALPYGLSIGEFCEKVTEMFAFWSGKKP